MPKPNSHKKAATKTVSSPMIVFRKAATNGELPPQAQIVLETPPRCYFFGGDSETEW